ncbi:TPA: nuclear transport factor 2 family protein [Enterobacter hormaechei subsp. steigerwaltii]|nr:nuclear transport factor 2 family protein [Enterobacter hormaechei subsp. steigerwaltii]
MGNTRNKILLGVILSLGVLVSAPVFSAENTTTTSQATYSYPTAPPLEKHNYSAYESLVLNNASMFHKNFSSHEFAKNGELVTPDIHWYKNGETFNGREDFIKGISGFVGIFPDVKIRDIFTTVDGNTVTVRYVITGTQSNDFNSPWGMIKATNKVVHIDGIEIMTFNKKGKLENLTTIEDLDQMREQLTAK